jgi:hypothetical protein
VRIPGTKPHSATLGESANRLSDGAQARAHHEAIMLERALGGETAPWLDGPLSQPVGRSVIAASLLHGVGAGTTPQRVAAGPTYKCVVAVAAV